MPETENSLSTEIPTPPSGSSTTPDTAHTAATSSSVTVAQTSTGAPSAGSTSVVGRLFSNISTNFVLYAEVLLVLYLVVAAVTYNNILARGWVEQVAFVVMAHQSSPAMPGKSNFKVPTE